MRITVHSRDTALSFDCGTSESILYAGLRQGVDLPFECATGTCGTCRARVMAGDVDVRWREAPGAARLKPDKGDILMCQTRARTDCELRVAWARAASEKLAPAMRSGVVRGIRRLTKDVAHFELHLSAPMTFQAGQFVVLEADGVTGGRAYSMVNFEPDCDCLAFVLKRKPDGHFSDWLFDSAASDAKVRVFGPLGRAVFRTEEHRDIACIADGSGIAGMLSILECAARADYFQAHKGAVFFGVRTLADAFYVERLSQRAAEAHDNLDVTIALSDEAPAAAMPAGFANLRLAQGMVHDVAAKAMADRGNGVITFVAGPSIMVDATIRSLITGGVPVRDIRYDKFG